MLFQLTVLKDISDVVSRMPPYKTPIFEIQTTTRTFLLQADSAYIMEEWLNMLNSLVCIYIYNEEHQIKQRLINFSPVTQKGSSDVKSIHSKFGLVKEGNLNKLVRQ